MDVAEHIASISSEGELLARTAERIPLDTRVPTCPGWRLRDLLAHIGYVHRWAAGYVVEARTEMEDGPGDEELLRLAPGDDVLIGWFRGGPSARRKLQAFDPRFAADGIDELLMGFARRGRRRAPDGLQGALWLRAVDAVNGAADSDGAGLAWAVTLGAEHTEISRAEVPAAAAGKSAGRYCEVSGAGSDLYLMLWNRQPPGALSVRGDSALLEAWRRETRIRWS